MKRDPRSHVVVDASVLAAYLSPKTHRNPTVSRRAAAIIDCVRHGWPLVNLYIPAFGITETQCVLDRHHYCNWHGPAKKREYQLNKREYETATHKLRNLQKWRDLRHLEFGATNLHAATLVSSVNAKYQFRRTSRDRQTGKVNKYRVRPPMGAADCLLLGLAIELGLQVGTTDVMVLTADTRMADVATRCRTLSRNKAEACGLPDVASQLGVEWSKSLYPKCIHLGRAADGELIDYFGHWPLPLRNIRSKAAADLTDRERRLLFETGQVIKQETKVGPDSLPYTAELDALQIRFAIKTGVYMPKAELAKQLLAWRKNPKSRPI